jgi:hypothetical protein
MAILDEASQQPLMLNNSWHILQQVANVLLATRLDQLQAC